jgi:hypothetical protein
MTPSVPGSPPRAGATGTCPSCGQPLGDERAVEQLRKSEREFERAVEAAVQARIAKLAGEFTARLEAEHQQTLAQLETRPDVDEERLASARARHAEEMDKLRTMFRQF